MRNNIYKSISLLLILFSTTAYSQYTAVPDVNFEFELIFQGYDTVLDGQILTSDINTITFLDVNNKNISSLVGINDFSALTTLHCRGNNLTVLNLSLVNLQELDCSANQLTTLNLSSLMNLTGLNISYNYLTSLDVSGMSTLNTLGCNNNNLTHLNLSNCISLCSLHCSYNQLGSLNLSGLTKLLYLDCVHNRLEIIKGIQTLTDIFYFYCNFNNLRSLDFSSNGNLHFMWCENNPLTTLIVTGTKMFDLRLSNTLIQNLNLNGLALLQDIFASNTLLTALNLKNKPYLTYSDIRNNSNLYCVEVDNVQQANSNISWYKDVQAIYSTLCGTISIVSWNCGNRINSFNSPLNTTAIPGITSYHFEITNGANTINHISSSNLFNLSQLTTPLNYDANYTIRVSYYINGVLQPFGNSCNVITPLPITNINSSSCGTTITRNTLLTANPINGAVSYRFEITNNTTNVVNYYNSPNNTFMLSQIPGGVIRNTNYNIRVSVFYNGQWYPYGSSCLLRTSWFSKQTEVSFNSIFKFSMFPNPAKDIVTIATETELKSVEIYSLQGQKVITSVSKTIEINNLPSGVYFVKVTAIEGLSNTKKLIIK